MATGTPGKTGIFRGFDADKLKHVLIGGARDIQDPHLFHQVSLIAFLAWVGLGADGLSSSAYGPDEAFKALGEGHQFMAVYLALATALTVFIISFAYSRIIEHFPTGGGGYVVATKLLGSTAGLISGSALLIDYVLTITVSVAAGADAVFSFLPKEYHHLKLYVEYGSIIGLIVMNLRGIKESITILVPIFLLFVFTHAVLLGGVFFKHFTEIPGAAQHVITETARTYNSFPTWPMIGMFMIFISAYSRGAGTFTGIEAVSNGLAIMREPKVATGKRTMVYMSLSLAITAGGILLCYYLTGVRDPMDAAKPMNAVLLENFVHDTPFFGHWFVVLTLVAEALLLTVAAQTGFIDGPRVMSNMALDSWLPHRFSSLSERLTTHYGVMFIGSASMAALWYTEGKVDMLVTMYSINVFVTFCLSMLGMLTFYIKHRKNHPTWLADGGVQALGLVLCFSILCMTISTKFREGAWMTLVITGALVCLCLWIRSYYRKAFSKLGLVSIDPEELGPGKELMAPKKMDPNADTAVLLVGSYGGLGVHSFTQIRVLFPERFKQIVFISVGVVDSGNFKGAEELEALELQTRASLEKYVSLANKFGMAAASFMELGNEPVEPAAELCLEVALRFKKAMYFAGKLVFQRETFWQQFLHNHTAEAIQNRLHWLGYPMLILPVRVWGEGKHVSADELTKSTVGVGDQEMNQPPSACDDP